MKASELRKKSERELNKTLQELRKNLRHLRFKLTSNKLKNIGEIKQTKKNIARIKTLVCESQGKRNLSGNKS